MEYQQASLGPNIFPAQPRQLPPEAYQSRTPTVRTLPPKIVKNTLPPQYKNNKKYTLITCGNKFSTNDLNIIIDSSYEELIRKKNPLSKYIIQRIKNILGGDWVVFICVDGLKGYDLSVSCNDENRLISFLWKIFLLYNN